MSRNLLHVKKLEQFKQYLTDHGFQHRPGRGLWQVLQVQINGGQWQCVFSRATMPEHLTVAYPLENVVKQFIRSTRKVER